ncbi:DUF5360 family protein [Amycolatopsis sp. NPDC051102]|uniref:DUF5360 family protein n=1 Tax=Amycolatopsis sp. NPDC051102 TaxID=3155163 RepID=UPI00344A3376
MKPSPLAVPCLTRWSLVLTDAGFLVYWVIVTAELIPPGWAFKDYADPVLTDWNYSFLVLDVLASLTGLAGLRALKRGHPNGRLVVAVSLTLTFTAGLQAISFWILRADFNPVWWLPNLWLLLFPAVAFAVLLRNRKGRR